MKVILNVVFEQQQMEGVTQTNQFASRYANWPADQPAQKRR